MVSSAASASAVEGIRLEFILLMLAPREPLAAMALADLDAGLCSASGSEADLDAGLCGASSGEADLDVVLEEEVEIKLENVDKPEPEVQPEPEPEEDDEAMLPKTG